MRKNCVTFFRGSMPPAIPADMDLPGFRLHPLKGQFRGFWAETVRANWRVIFRFSDRDVQDVDYVDYH
jgi:proteic killer suppression protein